MKSFFANWKTTIAGIGAIATAVGHLLTQISMGTWDGNMIMADLMAIIGGLGLLFAKDGNVTGGSVRQ